MTRKQPYTEEQMSILRENPYTYSVTSEQIKFTVAFKQFFYDQTKIPGMTSKKIMRAAGYNPDWFSKYSLDAIRIKIRKEAESPEGFKNPKGMSSSERIAAFAEKDLSRMHKDKAIKELQERVVHLEAQIEFLKKISHIRNQP